MTKDLIVWPQPNGTSRIVEADDIRALVKFLAATLCLECETEIPTGDNYCGPCATMEDGFWD